MRHFGTEDEHFARVFIHKPILYQWSCIRTILRPPPKQNPSFTTHSRKSPKPKNQTPNSKPSIKGHTQTHTYTQTPYIIQTKSLHSQSHPTNVNLHRFVSFSLRKLAIVSWLTYVRPSFIANLLSSALELSIFKLFRDQNKKNYSIQQNL